MSYCGEKNSSNWLCILARGHSGEHLSIDNRKEWKGTPGLPVTWSSETQKVVKQISTATSKMFTGRPCPNCGSMNTIPNGNCLLCLECKHTGECG